MNNIEKFFKGEFITEAKTIQRKLKNIRAFIFDWDGVFNDGHKSSDGSSSFSEIDAMGTNLLRFSNFLINDTIPFTAIITGEQNKTAIAFAEREHFTSIFTSTKNKLSALQHFCKTNGINTSEVAFIFDDVLDLQAAKECGIRIMINREVNPLLIKFAKKNKAVDYLTYANGANNAVRESSELLMGLSGQFENALQQRIDVSEQYAAYLAQRDTCATTFFTSKDLEVS